MIFTAQPVARNQSTSQEFASYGAQGLAPAPISAARIYTLATKASVKIASIWRRNIVSATISSVTNKMVTIASNAFHGVASSQSTEDDFMFAIPNIITSIDSSNEGSISILRSLGLPSEIRLVSILQRSIWPGHHPEAYRHECGTRIVRSARVRINLRCSGSICHSYHSLSCFRLRLIRHYTWIRHPLIFSLESTQRRCLRPGTLRLRR
jgi:hypothetical protein